MYRGVPVCLLDVLENWQINLPFLLLSTFARSASTHTAISVSVQNTPPTAPTAVQVFSSGELRGVVCCMLCVVCGA